MFKTTDTIAYFSMEVGLDSAIPTYSGGLGVLAALSPRVAVAIEGGLMRVCAWRYLVRGVFGHTVPVYFLDTAVEENSPWSQSLTDRLYGGDLRYRLCQEVVLGLGGVAMLRALGYDRIQPY